MEVAARLGKTWAGETFAGDYRARRKAVSVLETVLREEPDRADLRRLLVKAALEVGQFKPARDHLQAMLAEDGTARVAMTDVERGQAECFWGQLFEAEKKGAEQAAAWYRLAVRHDPEGQTAYVNLAWLLRGMAKKEIEAPKEKAVKAEADKLMDTLVEKNTDSARAYLALALSSGVRAD